MFKFSKYEELVLFVNNWISFKFYLSIKQIYKLNIQSNITRIIFLIPIGNYLSNFYSMTNKMLPKQFDL